MYNTLKTRKRTCLQWRLSEKKRVGNRCFDENMKDQVANRTQERKHLWEVWAAWPTDTLRSCTEKFELYQIVTLS